MKTLRAYLACLFMFVLTSIPLLAQEMPIYEWSYAYARHSGHGLWSDYKSTTDANGNVYLSGVFNAPMDADPGPGVFTLTEQNNNYDDVYLIKLNAVGVFQWAKSYTRLGAQNAPGSIAVDGAGNVFFASYYQVGFATNQTRINKIDAAGNEQWEKQIITNSFAGRELVLDPAGNVLIAGGFDGTVDFDPNAGVHNVAATATGTNVEMFLLKLDTDGNFLWVKTTSGPGHKAPLSMVTDASGNIIISGFYGVAQCDLDPGAGIANFTAVGGVDVFVMKLEADGDLLWARSMGGTVTEMGNGVAVSPAGNIFVTGTFNGSGDFDPTAGVTTLSTTTDSEIFLVRLNADGSFGWASQFGTPGEPDEGKSVTVDAAGNVLFSGAFYGTVDFDPGPGVHNLTGSSTFTSGNAFIAKVTENQGLIWARDFDSSSGSHSSMATSIKTGNAGFVTVVGHSSGGFRANFGPCNNTMGTGAFIVKLSVGVEGQPTLTGITPTSGPVGTQVVIEGTNFGNAEPADFEVRFGGSLNATVTAATPTSVTVTVPPTANSGQVYLKFKCYNGVFAPQTFTVGTPTTPTITSFTPNSGAPGTTVTIAGTNFSPTPANNTVRFNGTPAVVTTSTATSITTTVPAGATTGPITVVVNAITATSAGNFNVTCGPSPTITSFTPATGTTGTVVTIYGTNFSTTPANNVVHVNGTIVPVTASTATTMSLTIPVGVSGTGPITVLVNGCGPATSSGNFTMLCPNPPTVTSFTPASGDIGSTITITGTNFTTTPADHVVHVNGVLAQVTSSTATTLSVTVPPNSTGTGPITIKLSDCAVVTSAINFTVTCPPAPTITSFTPTSGIAGTAVTITGTNFSAITDYNVVDFNGVNAVVTSSTPTSIVATVPAGASPGPINVATGCTSVASATNFDFYAMISITLQPVDIILCEGDGDAFFVGANGAANINFQWQFSPDGIVPFEDIDDADADAIEVGSSGGGGFFRCVVNGDFATAVVSDVAELSVNPRPSQPTVAGSSRCGDGAVTLNASGGSDGQYRWYTGASGGTSIAGAVNGTYMTDVLSATTDFYVALSNGNCESARTPVTATVIVLPAAPVTTGASACPQSSVTLTASGGAPGQYRWYDVATGGSPIAGETNGSYTTPALTTTTTYHVSVTSTGCEGPRSPVVATILTAGCAPEFAEAELQTEPGGTIVIDLKPLITTIGTLDVSSIVVTGLPSSGATTSIADGVLTITYSGTAFSGNETITIQACNTNGTCSEHEFEIVVVGDVMVYNAVSPNGDQKNDFFTLEFIDLMADTKANQVFIYNRWGDEVFSVNDYNNTTRVFAGLGNDGNRLPSGVYFYKVLLPQQNKTLTGYIDLRF